MPRRAPRVCSKPGCPELTDKGRCTDCQAEAERTRGTAAQRGYGAAHRDQFRSAVLAREPACVCTDAGHGHAAPCGKPSKHADHWPVDKRTLIAQGLDSNDPRRGRGLCAGCHNRSTAVDQPGGGWNSG